MITEPKSYELANAGHAVTVVPISWRKIGGVLTITKSAAFCRECSWETKVFASLTDSIKQADDAARRHVGLLSSDKTTGGES